MKKSLVMCGIAALALASCTQNEVLNVNESRTIGFDGFIGKPTRGEVTTDNLTAFQVFGGYDGSYTNVYNDVAVTKSGDTWGTTEPKYWQNNKTYTFNAYAPSGVSASVGENGVTITDFQATDGSTDLIVAQTVSQTTDDSFMANPTKIAFTFDHILSMIKFTFSTTLADVNITISDLKVNGVPCKATYTAAEGGASWGTPDTQTKANYDLTVEGTIDDTAETGKKSSTEAIVIPQTPSDDITVTFTLNATGALTVTDAEHTVTLPTTAWEKGKRYNYTAEINIDNIDPENHDGFKEIEFGAPTVNPWVDQEGDNVTFPKK